MAPGLVATSNVLTRKQKSIVVPINSTPGFGQDCYQVCVIRLGERESLRVLSLLGKICAQETKQAQDGDHEGDTDNMHSKRSPLRKVPV